MFTPSRTSAARRTAFVAALCAGVMGGCGDDPLGPYGPEVDPQAQAFAVLVNEHRDSIGCSPLVWNGAVADVAQAHSADMVDRDYFSHTNPDGESPFDRMTSAGITYSNAAENIAWGYGTPEAVLDGWLNSSGHKANIENCALTEHGVGLVDTRWTHLFRTP